MKTIRLLGMSLISLLLTTSLIYAGTDAINKMYLDLDAPAGRIANWKSTATNINQISGFLKIAEIKNNGKWLPMVSITLEDKDRNHELWLRITNHENGMFSVFLEHRKNREAYKSYKLPKNIKLNEKTAFNINWKGENIVGISLQGMKRINVPLEFEVTRIGIVSSTADLLIDELELK